MKLSKAIEGYLLYAQNTYSTETVIHYHKTLKKVLNHLGDREVESIKSNDLQQYFLFLRTEYKPYRFSGEERLMSPAGVEGYWKALRSFFKWFDDVFSSGRPDKAIPQPKYQLAQVQAFSRDELKRIIYSAEWTKEISRKDHKPFRMRRPCFRRDIALVKLLLDTGLRIGEVSRLKVKDIDLETGQIVVAPFGSGQKTKPRFVFLGKSAKQAMWVYLASKDIDKEDSIFGAKVKYLQQIVHKIGADADVPNCHPHRFRHTFAIEYLRSHRDPFTLMRLLGHSTLDMSRHYLDILDSDLKDFHATGIPVDNLKL